MIVDGLVELGRYAEAGRELQRFVDPKPTSPPTRGCPTSASCTATSRGAAQAMRRGLSAGGDTAENAAYVQTLLGTLEFDRGRLGAAARARSARRSRASRATCRPRPAWRASRPPRATGAAIRRYGDVVARLPLPEYVVALGETELAAGRAAEARRDLALVGAEERLLQANGVNTDVDLALFEANHGSAARAVALARRAWAAAPSVRSADALGWALTRAGQPAGRPRLGPARAGAGLARPGLPELPRRAERARPRRPRGRAALLRAALADNPRFSPPAPRARRALEALREARRSLVAARAAARSLALAPRRAGAHPLGNFSINHLDPGARLPRPHRPALHPRPGRDPHLPGARPRRRRAVLARKRAEVQRRLTLTVDGRPSALTVRTGARLDASRRARAACR